MRKIFISLILVLCLTFCVAGCSSNHNNGNLTDKGGFKVRVRKTKFNGAGELKKFSGKTNVHFSEIYEDYISSPYRYLQGLISMNGIPETDYYKYFVNIEYEILNKYGAQGLYLLRYFG